MGRSDQTMHKMHGHEVHNNAAVISATLTMIIDLSYFVVFDEYGVLYHHTMDWVMNWTLYVYLSQK